MKTKGLNPVLITFLAAALVSLSPARAVVSFGWAAVGDVSNAADPLNSASVPGIGSVSTEYKIATKEVNLIQYTEFLNAVDPNGLNTQALYNASMASNANIAGIAFNNGASAGSKYSVMGSGLRPVTFVSWNDSARFVNWLENGQGAGSTETGVYTMSLGTPVRSGSATYFLPTENEWYKAAYYDPGVSGPGDDYWLYPTRSDSAPGNVIGSGANQANMRNGSNEYSVTQSSGYSSSQNYLTDGGAYTDSESYYGTYDQGGNVWEWNETIVTGSSRGLRGGSWDDAGFYLRSSARFYDAPTLEGGYLGFRVASVPEPSAVMLMLVGGVALLARRRRKVTL